MKRQLIALCLLIMMFSGAKATAAENKKVDVVQAQSQALDLEGLQDIAENYLDGADLTQSTSLDQGLNYILDTGSAQVFGILRKAVRSGVLLLAVVLLCSLAEGMRGGLGENAGVDTVAVAGALAVAVLSVIDVHSLVGLGREAISNMETFSKVLLPTITAAAAAGGSPTGAVARQLATILFSDVLMTLINRLLLPLAYAYIAAGVAYAAIGNEGLKRIGSILKWVVTSVLTTVLLVFVGYLTVSGVIAGTTDAVTIKAAKFTMSSMVPVVGGILSDAAETVLAGAGILKNAVGVFGMLVVLCICLVPFLQLGIHYLIYKATAALAATVSTGRVSGLIESISGAFGLVLGMAGACALLLLVSLVSAISVVTV